MIEKTTETGLLAKLGALPCEIAPENDVWPAIAKRIEQETAAGPQPGSTNRWWHYAVAASFTLLLAAGILLGRPWSTDQAEPQISLVSGVHGERASAGALSGTLAATELEYHAAFREFISVGDPTGNLKLNTMEKLLAVWMDLRNTEAGLSLALQQNPDNPFLNEKMLKLRSRQLDFLKQIAALERSSRRTMI